MAAMRLAEQPNYRWLATVADDARTYDIKGQTSRDGYTRVTMPLVNSLRRRLRRSATDTDIEFIFRGNVACVIATDEGWRTPAELPAASPEPTVARSPGGPSRGGPGLASGSRRPDGTDEGRRRYSNLQLGLSHPHEELGVIVSSHLDLHPDGDCFTGTLNELGARLLLVKDGQREISPVRATGTFTLWVREGLVTRYQVRLAGVLQVDTPGGRRQVSVTQTTDTTIRDVGTTQFDVPEEARIRLAP